MPPSPCARNFQFTAVVQKSDDIILHPFCGSGSTLAAARSVGGRFIGIELDGEHFLTASRRLETTRTGGSTS